MLVEVASSISSDEEIRLDELGYKELIKEAHKLLKLNNITFPLEQWLKARCSIVSDRVALVNLITELKIDTDSAKQFCAEQLEWDRALFNKCSLNKTNPPIKTKGGFA